MTTQENMVENWMEEIGLNTALKKVAKFEKEHEDYLNELIKQTRLSTIEEDLKLVRTYRKYSPTIFDDLIEEFEEKIDQLKRGEE
jgi:hypothetical protein